MPDLQLGVQSPTPGCVAPRTDIDGCDTMPTLFLVGILVISFMLRRRLASVWKSVL